MITSEGKALQENAYQALTTRRKIHDIAVESARLHTDYFNNIEFDSSRFTSWFWNILPYLLEAILYTGMFAYLFTWKTALVGLTPALGYVFIVWIGIRISKYHIRIKKHMSKHHTMMHLF
ncbi:MAG: hypothetical protein JXR88_16775 [Clostridia bacterium]|nr:hypothetical protein [Clostridia bacterium]